MTIGEQWRRNLEVTEAVSELLGGERNFEVLIATGGAAKEDDIARGQAERPSEQFGDSGIRVAVNRGCGDADFEAASIVEPGDSIAGGAGSDADVKGGHGECVE